MVGAVPRRPRNRLVRCALVVATTLREAAQATGDYSLADDAWKYYKAGLATSTQKTYKRGVNSWNDFCTNFDCDNAPFSGSIPLLHGLAALWFAWIARTGTPISVNDSTMRPIRNSRNSLTRRIRRIVRINLACGSINVKVVREFCCVEVVDKVRCSLVLVVHQ